MPTTTTCCNCSESTNEPVTIAFYGSNWQEVEKLCSNCHVQLSGKFQHKPIRKLSTK